MNILGIETSCDETSASVVTDGHWIHSNVVATSLAAHQKYGGIIPEIASRRQLEFINAVVEEALAKAGTTLNHIDAIAVTRSPGLVGSLLVGISFARALAFAAHKRLIEVNHIHAHLYANLLRNAAQAEEEQQFPQLPAVGLVVSGGHSSLFVIRKWPQCVLLGQTRDDAAGEAFDKVAKILNLGYPGGPVIDRLAQQGINDEIRFPSAELPGSFDFSFSGTKTAVLYYVNAHRKLKGFSTEKIAYSFQKSVTQVLIEKCFAVCRKKNIKTLLIGGGVAANSALRAGLAARGKEEMIDVHFPPMPLCLDNAAMIAGLAFHQLRHSAPVRKRKNSRLPRAVRRHF